MHCPHLQVPCPEHTMVSLGCFLQALVSVEVEFRLSHSHFVPNLSSLQLHTPHFKSPLPEHLWKQM